MSAGEIRARSRMRVRDLRDGVLLADAPEAAEESANRLFVTLGERLRAARLRGLRDAVPAARSLLLLFDPLRLSAERVRAELGRHSLAAPEADGSGRTLIVRVAYDGPDLDELARGAGISSEEFARRHAAADYRVAFLGFAPGFAYLTGLPPELAAPRLSTPRTRVPAGSVAIGGSYTGVYPAASPGGWRLIGTTTVQMLDAQAQPPALLRAGDRVRFESVAAGALAPPTPARPVASRGTPILRVLSPGLAATVQGGPLDGLGSSGVPAGGAIDPLGLARVNALVGNAPGAPGLEVALRGDGPELEALGDCVAAAGGLTAEIGGRPRGPESALRLSAGDRVRLRRAAAGAWGYLAVAGGLEAPSRLAPQPRLKAGAVLCRAAGADLPARAVGTSALRGAADSPPEPGEIRLRVVPGPESDSLAPPELERLLATPWRVSGDSDRRGLRLEGDPIGHREAPEIPPSGTVPGTIQLPGGGLPIVLGPDGPVTGGYPRVATVIGADLPLLGRAAPGTVLRLVPVTLSEALVARRSSPVGVP